MASRFDHSVAPVLRVAALEARIAALEHDLAYLRTLSEDLVRSQAVARLATVESHLEAVLSATSQAYILVDTELRLLQWNHIAEAEIMKRTGLILRAGRPVGDYMIAEAKATRFAMMQRALAGESIHTEMNLGTPNVPLWIAVSYVPIRQACGSIGGVCMAWLDVSARYQTEAELRTSSDQLQHLSRRLVEAHERERRHIARELHDEVGQVLTGLKLSLAAATLNAPPELAAPLNEAQGSLTELMGRVRDLSLDLRPALLDDMGLLPALGWFLERYIPRTGIQIDLRHYGLNRRFTSEVETVAYRIIQEALTNVARHAEVQAATVRLIANDQRLMLRVDDMGQGFDLEEVRTNKYTGGLSGMQERVQLIGGTITIEAALGMGTHIIAELPLGE
ncbi:PAS domain-containing sensor histidine kinase [Candidatus Viridilinea mediisalina]|uniref:histidine kinase n=1 Tax=Candidatus Viridilinea mediisalina TaxID=2024553 RepID=A0A2A6RMI1_9CHLR|nr:histidine kinase [Candidatus Viridilinea mediisalina]PDW04257.1 hypothetical protein CJ255_04720 [Candidatus Viridilinea mediisalina]